MTTDKEKIVVLTTLLQQAQALGLTFDIGSVYIRRAYITHQTDLNNRIHAALNQPIQQQKEKTT